MRKLSVGILALVLVICLTPMSVVAAENVRVNIPLVALNNEEPLEFSGLIASHTLDLPLPDKYQVAGNNSLTLVATSSELLDAPRSSLTILLNGLHVQSLTIEQISGKTSQVDLPLEFFSAGQNTLSFEVMLYLPSDQDGICRDWDNPARWFSLDATSNLNIELQQVEQEFTLDQFPEAILPSFDQFIQVDGTPDLLFVLPDDISDDDMSSLVNTSYLLGINKPDNFKWQTEVVQLDDFDASMAAGRGVVFIREYPQEISLDTKLDKDFIYLGTSPWDPTQAVLVVGDQDEDDGYTPVAALGDPVTQVLLKDHLIYLDQKEYGFGPGFSNQLTLKDLGYLDRTVRGIGDQNITYRLYIPYNVLVREASLNLVMSHSPELDTENSVFTILVNGYTVAGILPTARSANLTPITVSLPSNRLRPGVNFIRINFNLKLQETKCQEEYERVWATVYNSSKLTMLLDDTEPIPTLEHFPVPYNSFPGFSYVIPDDTDLQTLQKLTQLTFEFGKDSDLAYSPPTVIRTGNFNADDLQNPHLILVGLFEENPVLAEVNSILPVLFDPSTGDLEQRAGVFSQMNGDEASYGVIQTASSPWSDDGRLLVISGNSIEGLDWAIDVLLDRQTRSGMTGNIALVGSKLRTADPVESEYIIEYQQVADVSMIPIIGPYLQRSGVQSLSTQVISVGLGFVIIAVVVILLRRNRNI